MEEMMVKAAEESPQTAVRDGVTEKKEYFIPEPRVAGGRGYLAVKRVFDIVMSLTAGIVLLIPMLIIAIAIRIDSKGDIIFKQERLGKDAKPFTMYKFRTLCAEAPDNVATNNLENLDSLTTKLGRFLRRTSLDELPQLFNVLKGDMSFVGYRPVCLAEENLNSLRLKYGILQTKPGISGYAQVNGRDDISMEEKVKLDLYYIEHRGLVLDLWCILKTVLIVFTREGAK